jgi:hypothetical protein
MLARLIAVLILLVTLPNGSAQHKQMLDSHQLARKAHPKDPVLQEEHAELLDLLTDGEATATAIRDGAWSDPRIWKEGALPGSDARVLILEGTTVTLDEVVKARLRTLLVNGSLEFVADRNTGLTVDTMVVSPTGHLIIGRGDIPIAADKKVEIVFAGLGPIDTNRDPRQFGRGLISHGSVTVHGADVTPYVPLARPAQAGDRRLLLKTDPVNWKRGDRLILPGTHPGPPPKENAMGNVEPPAAAEGAAFSKKPAKPGASKNAKPGLASAPPRKASKVQTHDSSLRSSRSTEDEELTIVDINGSEVTVRPLLHDHRTPAEDIALSVANVSRNVVFRSGRPAPIHARGHVMFMHSPRVRLENAGFYDLGRTNKLQPIDDPVVKGEKRLVPGTGTNPRGRYSVHVHRTGTDLRSEPIRIRGCAVVNDPGWGFVNHSSHVEFDNNVAYNVDGSAFVTEAGDEVGAFRGNLAVRCVGSGEGPSARDQVQDFGHEGDGFWFQGGGLIVENNIASGCGHAGFFYFTRGLVQPGLGRTQFLAANLEDTSWASRYNMVNVGDVPIRSFKGNVAFASHIGYAIRYQMVGSGKFGGPANPGGSVLQNGLVWNTNYGVRIQYSERVTLRNLRLIGDPHSKSALCGVLDANEGTRGLRYENLHVEGWNTGIDVKESADHVIDGGYFNNFINIYVPMPLARDRVIDIRGDIRFGILSDRILGDRRQYDLFLDGSFRELLQGDFRGPGRNPNTLFAPILTKLNTVAYQGKQIYFLEQKRDYTPFSEDMAGSVPDQLIEQTNEEMWRRYGLAIGGTLPPADAHEELRIHGLVGSPIRYPRDLQANCVNSNQLSGCQLKLMDHGKHTAASTTANLHPGWNLVTMTVDGAPRSIIVFGGEAKRYEKKGTYKTPTDAYPTQKGSKSTPVQ